MPDHHHGLRIIGDFGRNRACLLRLARIVFRSNDQLSSEHTASCVPFFNGELHTIEHATAEQRHVPVNGPAHAIWIWSSCAWAVVMVIENPTANIASDNRPSPLG